MADQRDRPGAEDVTQAEHAAVGEPRRRRPLACRIFDHHWRFALEGASIVWICQRCGHEGGKRDYPSRDEARRYLHRLNRGGGPPVGLLAVLGGTLDRRRQRERRQRP